MDKDSGRSLAGRATDADALEPEVPSKAGIPNADIVRPISRSGLTVDDWDNLQSYLWSKANEHGWNSWKREDEAEYLSERYGKAAYIIERVTQHRWRLLRLSMVDFGANSGFEFLYDNLYPATADIPTFYEAREWMMSSIERRDRNLGQFVNLKFDRREYDHKGMLIADNYLERKYNSEGDAP